MGKDINVAKILEDLKKHKNNLKKPQTTKATKLTQSVMHVVPDAKTTQKDKKLTQKVLDSQVAIKSELNGNSNLQNELYQSESLQLAQKKIINLEEELQSLRESNKALFSAGDVLKEKVEGLLFKKEDLLKDLETQSSQFDSEKSILITTLRASQKEKVQLDIKNKELEKRLSRDLQNIRGRESVLENRIEIIRMESSVLQREKDKKILELQKKIHKSEINLKHADNKHQEMRGQVQDFRDSSRKTIAVLRATIHNLEGRDSDDFTKTSLGEDHSE